MKIKFWLVHCLFDDFSSKDKYLREMKWERKKHLKLHDKLEVFN